MQPPIRFVRQGDEHIWLKVIMNINPSVRGLLLGIMRKFPDVGTRMKHRARKLRSVEFATTEMMNEFSDVTSEAIRDRNESEARTYLDYVSKLLDNADEKVEEYIDVYYVEILMYDLDNESRKWGWPIIPSNLKELYVAMWGKPKFSE